ncbi:hypothetical protein ACFLRT_00410 [Acidobacteriota bacterium]
MLPDIQPMDLGGWIRRFKKKLDEHRIEDFDKFYKLLIEVENGVKERTELLQFLKSILHNEQFFLEDGINIRLRKDLTCKYSSLRKQLYLSLFAMIGGVYDTSARLCMLALDKNGGVKINAQIHPIFFNKKNPLTLGHQDIIGRIKSQCGYFLGVITFLRNFFIHRGEVFFNGKDLFLSNDCRDCDSLNPEILADIEDGAHREYKIKDFRNNKDPDIRSYSGKPLIDLVNAYLLKIDHGIGCLLSRLLAKHIGI